MTSPGSHRRASRLKWAIYVPWGLSDELGIRHRVACKLTWKVHRRRILRLMFTNTLILTPIIVVWCSLIGLGLFYQATYQFQPNGTPTSVTTTGPFGITSAPLAVAYVLVFGGGWLVLSVAGFVIYDAIVGRECRRCARTPACFTCGYDLSAVVGDTCPECGTPRVPQPSERTVTP